jgi:LuxR family transcriptional regulator
MMPMRPACKSGYRETGVLDQKELEALILFANGKTAGEIANTMNLSISMINNYLRVSTRKLRARNRVHAVAIAVRIGLVP